MVFELQGGMITRLIDAMYREGGIEIISMHHEQAAAMAADAFGRITGKPGVALATSGPGATNLLTGIGCCYFDSVPAIFITGQVNVNEQKGNNKARQIGFQETDIVSMAAPITKKSYLVKTASEIPTILEEAYTTALSGRPGPVLIDIPMNVQHEDTGLMDIKPPQTKIFHDTSLLQAFVQDFQVALSKSKMPLILAGRGIRASNTVKQFQEFLGKFRIPVVTSLLGLDVLPYHHPERVGFIGTYGNRWANFALGTCDLLLVLGSRLDLRQTGSDVTSFKIGKQIYHVDIEPTELNNRITGCHVINSGLDVFLQYFNQFKNSYKAPSNWIKTIEEKKLVTLDTSELKSIAGINPNIFIHELFRASQLALVFAADTGNNQMWCAQSLELNENQLFLTSGGMGAMGYALPAAIGASLSLAKKPVVAIAGDGGFQLNIQELQTIKRNNLPVKMVVFNNHCLGMIRQFQDAYFQSCYHSTVWGYDSPDFVKIANAWGIDSFSISKSEEIEKGLALMWENPNIPFLLSVEIDVHTNVHPKTMFGFPITEMEPRI